MQGILCSTSKYNELRVENINKKFAFSLLINKGFSILYLALYLIPITIRYFPNRPIITVAIILLWLITAGLYSLKWLKKVNIIFLILSLTCFAFFIIVYNALAQISMLRSLENIYYYFLSFFPVLMFWFYYDNSPAYLRTLTNLALAMIVITIFTTLVGLDKYITASRLLAGGASKDQAELFTSLNIGGYLFGYGLVFLIPVLAFTSKKSLPLKKVLSILLIFMIAYLNYKSMFVTAFIFCIILLVISVAIFQEKKVYFILLLFLAPAVLLFFQDIFMFLLELNFIKESFMIHKHLVNIYELIFYDYGLSHFSRYFVYSRSISVLEKNYLLGYAASGQMGGGHMQWIDFINHYGLVGVGLLLGVFYTIYKGFKKIFRFDLLLCIIIVFVAILVMGSIKNAILSPISGIIIFFLMPSILFLLNHKKI